MKRFVLVLVCTLIVLFFVGFNYLLWDRENKAEDIKTLEYTSENKENYINYLTAEKKRIDMENENLNEKIETLEESIAALDEQMEIATGESEDLKRMLQESNELVELLLKQVDKQMISQIAFDYVDYVNNKKYREAYNIRYGHDLGYVRAPDLKDFISVHQDNIESITLENVEYYEEYTGLLSGKHAFNVELDVQLKEGADERGCEFVPGTNIMMFIMGFDKQLKEWFITDVSYQGS